MTSEKQSTVQQCEPPQTPRLQQPCLEHEPHFEKIPIEKADNFANWQ